MHGAVANKETQNKSTNATPKQNGQLKRKSYSLVRMLFITIIIVIVIIIKECVSGQRKRCVLPSVLGNKTRLIKIAFKVISEGHKSSRSNHF